MTLEEIRGEIDRIDTKMKELFIKRIGMSKQVAKAKAITGGDVYVADREREIIEKRAKDTDEDIAGQYISILKSVMCISRTYQYSLLEGMQKKYLDMLPIGQGEFLLAFTCTEDTLFSNMEALSVSGLSVLEMNVEKKDGKDRFCRVKLFGDFAEPMARAAVLQIIREGK